MKIDYISAKANKSCLRDKMRNVCTIWRVEIQKLIWKLCARRDLPTNFDSFLIFWHGERICFQTIVYNGISSYKLVRFPSATDKRSAKNSNLSILLKQLRANEKKKLFFYYLSKRDKE